MKITKEFLEHEIKAAEQTVAKNREQLLHAQGCVSILRQLLDVLDEPETECQPETHSLT